MESMMVLDDRAAPKKLMFHLSVYIYYIRNSTLYKNNLAFVERKGDGSHHHCVFYTVLYDSYSSHDAAVVPRLVSLILQLSMMDFLAFLHSKLRTVIC